MEKSAAAVALEWVSESEWASGSALGWELESGSASKERARPAAVRRPRRLHMPIR